MIALSTLNIEINNVAKLNQNNYFSRPEIIDKYANIKKHNIHESVNKIKNTKEVKCINKLQMQPKNISAETQWKNFSSETQWS